MNNSVLLILDTTTPQLHLGLSQNSQLIAEQAYPGQSHRYHSALVVPAIQELLSTHHFTANNLTGLAVCTGPGSFTGLRTGIITMRTMAQFLNIPIYGFNRFELLAESFSQPVAIYLDAMRGKSFHASLAIQQGRPEYLTQPQLVYLDNTNASLVTEHLPLIEEPLKTFFEGQASQILTNYQPIRAMHQLIQKSPESWITRWQEVRPLYLQEPSITLKKTAPSANP